MGTLAGKPAPGRLCPGEPEGPRPHRLVSYADHGPARQCVSAADARHGFSRTFTGRDIRHWFSLQQVTRDDCG
eukprot:8612233-Pyramimonas_sp.AAC.1